MKLNELKNKKVAAEIPMGKNEVIFQKIDYHIFYEAIPHITNRRNQNGQRKT